VSCLLKIKKLDQYSEKQKGVDGVLRVSMLGIQVCCAFNLAHNEIHSTVRRGCTLATALTTWARERGSATARVGLIAWPLKGLADADRPASIDWEEAMIMVLADMSTLELLKASLLDGRVYTARIIRDKVEVLDDWMLDPYVLLYLIGTCIGDFACPANSFAWLTVRRIFTCPLYGEQ